MSIDDLFHRGLSLDKLRAFVEVVRSESVTAAAKGQPSRRSLMSRQIGELERTLGIELFTRKGKALHLTEAGRELALITAAWFTEFGTTVERFLTAQETLRLGAGASVFEALLFPRLAGLEQAFPGVRFEFVGASTAEAVQMLHQGKIDLAILRSGLSASGLVEIPACSISFRLVGRRDFDRGIGDWSVTEFLGRVPLTVIGGQGQWLEALRRLCDKLDVTPRWGHRVETFGHVRELLKAGAAGGLLPRALTEELDGSVYRVMGDPALATLDRRLSIVYDSRAGKVRDRLVMQASKLAEVLRPMEEPPPGFTS